MHHLLRIAVACTIALAAPAQSPQRPNILLVLADDLGYGDVACYNPESKVPTPNVDRLAGAGMRFTDAHSPSTVCTPTRYSILTGRQCFRTGFRGVFTGIGGPCLIEPERLTLAEMLRQAGYRTAMSGKWHIGLTAFDETGAPVRGGGVKDVARVDFTRPFVGGPTDQGFEVFFGTASCPTTDYCYAFIDGNRVPVPPVATIDKSRYPKNAYTRDFRAGLAAPDFDASQVDLVFLEKSRAFLREHVKQHADEPFFLFHSMQAVHLPSIPAERFRGRSDAGPHGDFLLEMDWIVGELLDELDELGVADDTLVVFCSDNGPEVPTVIDMRRRHGHDGARPWRGVKRDQWEGGHRTPFVVRWSGKVEAGAVSDQPLSLTDLFATFAAILEVDLPNDAAEDSFDMSPVWLGEATHPIRPFVLSQTMRNALAIRRGRWKYLDHRGSGGNDYTRDGEWGMKQYALVERDPDAPGQLYDLGLDPGEADNVYREHPDVVRELKALLDRVIADGRSAPRR